MLTALQQLKVNTTIPTHKLELQLGYLLNYGYPPYQIAAVLNTLTAEPDEPDEPADPCLARKIILLLLESYKEVLQ